MNLEATHVVVLDDSPIFSLFAAHAVEKAVPGVRVIRSANFTEALPHMTSSQCQLVVCGYGVGEGMTAHDVRRVSDAPMVLLTGRPLDEIGLPSNSRVVTKGAGPEALQSAVEAAVRG